MYQNEFLKFVKKRMQDNQSFFSILFENQEIYDRVKKEVLRKVYEECRSGTA